MVDRRTLIALAERAEAGGDDRLSDDVWRAMKTDLSQQGWASPPDLACSIDAQAELPGRINQVRSAINMGSLEPYFVAWASTEPRPQYGIEVSGSAPTEPLARLAAKLRALAAATPEERG